MQSNATPQIRIVKNRPAMGVSFAARLTFEHISHHYDADTPVLRDVSLNVEPGKVLCLLGPSGSGKSTILRIAAGIERQTMGRVLLNEKEIAGPNLFLPPEKRPIGMVFQDYALFPHLSVVENVRFGLTKLGRKEGRASAMQALERVGLETYADRYPRQLSGGEQQRVALARAVAPRPQVILLDEPFSGLDSRLRDEVRADTLSTLRQTRATTIIVTHDAEEAMLLGDSIALIKDGMIEQAGSIKDVFNRPQSLFASQFLAPVNILDLKAGADHVDTPLGVFGIETELSKKAVTVAIRVTGIVATRGCGPGEGTVPARIRSRHFLGAMEMLIFSVNGTDQTIRGEAPFGHIPSDVHDVYLKIDPNAVRVFENREEND